jgi:uncharacterized membrane protein
MMHYTFGFIISKYNYSREVVGVSSVTGIHQLVFADSNMHFPASLFANTCLRQKRNYLYICMQVLLHFQLLFSSKYIFYYNIHNYVVTLVNFIQRSDVC